MINQGAESLPPKDGHAYKQLAKFYDSKNYKKGLKNADKLLEIHPDHPETNALKALFLQALGQDVKALEVAKMSLIKSKMKSMFCWHTCATIYKAKKDFVEAAKCFQNAMRLEPDNMQLMKETACLQVQVRDLTGHAQSRFNILKQKPNMIQNWVAFTISHHLRGDFPALFKALHSLDNIVKTAELKPTDLAHYYVYRVVAFKDAGNFEGMYAELQTNRNQIKDEVFYYQMLYKACVELNKSQEAINSMEFLLKKFPDNLEYLKQYQNLHHLQRREACIKARTDFNSKIAQVHELACIDDDVEFKKEFSSFVKPYYKKNLISLYAEIQVLYETGKYSLIEDVFLQYEKSLEKDQYPDGSETISPSEYLWSLYLLAQHYSQRYDTLLKAYDYIQRALKHTCTVSEFYLVKADIEYKLHNNLTALKTINQARKTDLADRYMNNICVKYLMKCEKPDLAENVLRMFMRDDASLYELQNHWYIIEAAKSFLKQRNFASGLKHLDFINKQFLDFQGNEFDFHTYCLRRWTLKEYIELIQFNDNIYDDKKYAEAAGYALRYLKEYVYFLEEEEKKAKEQVEKTKEEEGKKKKKKKKAEQTTQEENPIEIFRNKIDYYGKDYSEKIKKNPLEEALNYAKCVSTIKYTNKGNLSENKLFGRAFSEAIDVFIHFKKPLLVLRCISKLKRTNCCPFSIHQATVKALIYLQSYLADPKASDLSKEIVTEFLDSTLAGKSLAEYNDVQTKEWKEKVSAQQQFLVETKIQESSFLLKHEGPELRKIMIDFYTKELSSLSSGEQIPTSIEMQLIFYYSHRLEFFGQLTSDLKTALDKKTATLTTYFSDWRNEVMKLPESTWSMWWLSDYDIEREENEEKEEKEKEKKDEKGEKGEKTVK